MSKIEVDAVTQQSGSTLTVGGGASKTLVADATTVTLGRCGGTVALASGATQSGFGRTGTVDWNTTPKTATFTAVSGDGFFANTTGSAFNMNLPAGVAGAIVSVADYAGTWGTNALTVVPNGSDKIGGINANVGLTTEGQSVTFIFVDSTQGWINIQDSTSNERGSAFISATGGTITTCGNCKVHTFTGPGTFTVSGTAVCAANNQVSYMVVAGGGAGGSGDNGGGGGAGGFRETKSPVTPYTASPLDGQPSAPNRITVTATAFPITVGSGGASNTAPPPVAGGNGSPSIFSTITSTGGGGGGSGANPGAGSSGGSGGGGGYGTPGAGGSGNTPPVSPSQGNNGGNGNVGTPAYGTGGGGGAGAAGTAGSPTTAGPGGNGVSTSINFSSTAFAGGGGGNTNLTPTPAGAGGTGGGGTGVPGSSQPDAAIPGIANGTANTGGGGGSVDETPTFKTSGNGGSGIVIIRYKYQ